MLTRSDLRGTPHNEAMDERGTPETQEQRAIRAVRAIFSGGDLSAETLNLSNEFTDRHAARLGGWLRRGQTGRMSYENPSPQDEIAPDADIDTNEEDGKDASTDVPTVDADGNETRDPADAGSNASGSQSGGSAVTDDIVDSGMSEDVENSLTGQGISDRETTVEADRSETDARNESDAPKVD